MEGQPFWSERCEVRNGLVIQIFLLGINVGLLIAFPIVYFALR